MYRIGDATVKHIGNGSYEVTAQRYQSYIPGTPAAVQCNYRSLVHGLAGAINAAVELTLWLAMGR